MSTRTKYGYACMYETYVRRHVNSFHNILNVCTCTGGLACNPSGNELLTRSLSGWSTLNLLDSMSEGQGWNSGLPWSSDTESVAGRIGLSPCPLERRQPSIFPPFLFLPPFLWFACSLLDPGGGLAAPMKEAEAWLSRSPPSGGA